MERLMNTAKMHEKANDVLNEMQNVSTKYGCVEYLSADLGAVKDRLEAVVDEIWKCIEKLNEYEDLEEQGLLLKLPCKVGDTVYMTDGNSLTVREIHIQDNLVKYFVARFNPNGLDVRFTFDRIGKNVFLTQSEAGEALKRMEEQENVT